MTGRLTINLIFLVVMSPSIFRAQENNTPQVRNVIAVSTIDPTMVVVYWNPVKYNEAISYRVYYNSNKTDNVEMIRNVTNTSNSVVFTGLQIRLRYTFQVSILYVDDSNELISGPRTEITNNSTVIISVELAEDEEVDNLAGTFSIVLYGCLLILSLIMNIILLTVSALLLRQLRLKYNMNNSADKELKTVTDNNGRDHHKDIPHTRPTVLTVSQLPKIEEAVNECVDIDTTNEKETNHKKEVQNVEIHT